MSIDSLTPVSESATAVPAPPLRGLIAAYDGYRERGMSPARHLGLPSPFMTLIVTLHEPLHIVRHLDRARPATRFDTLVGGLHATPVVVGHEGAQSGVQLRVSPLASRALFGAPAGELAGTDTGAENVLGRLARELHERLADAESWSERFAILDATLSRRVYDQQPPPRPVREAWRLLLQTGGAMPVAAIAREVGWNERHLLNRFREEIGLTPKLAARVIRFDRARRALQDQYLRGGRADIAFTAAASGYFDQPHLVRDFQAFAEVSPGRWLRQEFGNVQDGSPIAT